MKIKKRLLRLTCYFCLLFMAGTVSASEADKGFINGSITTAEGSPMSGGYVRFFDAEKGPSPFNSDYWRGPDYFFPTTENGFFSAELPEGTYYLMAVKMKQGKRAACTPEEGDFVYPPMDADIKTYTVKAGQTVDVGVIAGAVPFRNEWGAKGRTQIQGIVLDMNGKAAEGKLVIAFTTGPQEKPFFVSDKRTDSNGAYILRVPEGGQYFVRVMGQKESVVAATVRTGETVKGVNIHLADRREK